jgi:hypothetical protein
MQSFYNSLSDDGVLVMQLGESPDSGDPDEMMSGDKNRVAALNLLETVGFESIHAYTEVSGDLSNRLVNHLMNHVLMAPLTLSLLFCSVSLWL